ncbi:MAG: hypothetical protein R2800_05540 [Flavipsychrobacter sp.]
MNKFLLWMVMLPSGIWKKLGVDLIQLKAILEAKLKMDDRKPLSFGGNKGVERSRKKKRKNTSGITMLLSFFMGIIYVFPITLVWLDPVMGLALFFTIFMFFLVFTLITDFSNVLVDTKDKFILFPRPIDDKTITLSRLLYVCIYLFRIVIPMSMPAWIVFTIAKGWLGFLWFPLPIFLSVFVVLLLVNGLYLLIIKLSKPGKFKEAINYFQIAFSIVFFATYMLGTRMIDFENIDKVNFQVFDWARYIPSYWLAAAWTWVEPSVKALPGTKILSVLAILFPFASLWITIKYLAPQFAKNLTKSEDARVVEEPIAKKKVKVSSDNQKALYSKLADLFNKNGVEKAGFMMTWLQTARSRTFKMRVYPSFAYVPVYFFYFMFNNSSSSITETMSGLKENTGAMTMLLYFTTFVILQALNFITMSDQYKAAWVYYATPVEKPGSVIAGAFKAMWVKYFLPFMIVIGGFVVYVWGVGAIIDILLAMVNITFFAVAITRISNRYLPFSIKEQIKDSGGKTVFRVIGTLGLIGGLGFVHYSIASVGSMQNILEGLRLQHFINLSWLTWLSIALKLIFLILSSILLWVSFDSLKNTSWETLKRSEEHM